MAISSLSPRIQEFSSGAEGKPIAKDLQVPQSLGAPFLPGTGIGREEPRPSPCDPEEQGKEECGEAPVQSCTTHMLRRVLQAGVPDLSPEEIA